MPMLVQSAVQGTPETVSGPEPIRQGFGISSSDYPSDALRQREYGVVSVLLRVNDAGRVTDCLVTESSRSASLDRGSCAVLRRRARFHPAQDSTGQSIASSYRMAVTWGVGFTVTTRTDMTLPVQQLPDHYERPAVIQMAYGADGHPASCTTLTSSGSPAADAAICRAVVAQLFITPPKSGSSEPALAVRSAHVSLAVTATPK